MTKEEAINKLEKLSNEKDTEKAHSEADIILCIFLNTLGYNEVVRAWGKIHKWYA